ncbi:hypothetical protein ACFQS7_01955 [Dankookia sp. GCM10030260]|uniref:hypothetical protein n=1 Tax=Dankookia sp. GCM10030260 TaxID=3273390 RepID=UPI0036117DD7
MSRSPMPTAAPFLRQTEDASQLVTVSVLYYLPDHRSLVNEFTWQTLDRGPHYARVEAFLDYWRREIDAVIKEVKIAGARPFAPGQVDHVAHRFSLN